jgi:hypothetical protein
MCWECGKIFEPTASNHQYCSYKCSYIVLRRNAARKRGTKKYKEWRAEYDKKYKMSQKKYVIPESPADSGREAQIDNVFAKVREKIWQRADEKIKKVTKK